MIVSTPEAPYYAVIFTSYANEVTEEYIETDKLVYEEACKIEGFIGMESVRQEMGISISYWVDLESIQLWKNNTSHQVAKRKGIE